MNNRERRFFSIPSLDMLEPAKLKTQMHLLTKPWFRVQSGDYFLDLWLYKMSPSTHALHKLFYDSWLPQILSLQVLIVQTHENIPNLTKLYIWCQERISMIPEVNAKA